MYLNFEDMTRLASIAADIEGTRVDRELHLIFKTPKAASEFFAAIRDTYSARSVHDRTIAVDGYKGENDNDR